MSNDKTKSYTTGHNYTGYGGSQGTTPYVSSFKSCDHPPKPIKAGDVEIYACARRDVNIAVKEGFDVISPLVQTVSSEFNGFYGLLLWFPIPDMTAPEPMRLRIHALRLIALARAGNRVVTFCEGSHGRTGTVIATCIGLLEPDIDPIDAVRERHCKDACETYKQIEAVFKACGREVPECWKESTAYKKYQPTWAQQGLTWSSTSKDVTNDIVGGGELWTCDMCNEVGGTGKNKLHWYGQVRAHKDCYDLAEKQFRDKQALIKANGQSSTAPSADSPPAVVSDTQKNALPIGGYHVNNRENDCCARVECGWLRKYHNPMGKHPCEGFLEAAPIPGDVVTTTDVEESPDGNRPFFDRWSGKQRQKYSTVKNEKDQFGDLICPLCEYLIVDPYTAQKVIGTAQHTNCATARHNLNAVPLCIGCSADFALPEKGLYCPTCEEAIDLAEENIDQDPTVPTIIVNNNGTIIDAETDKKKLE